MKRLTGSAESQSRFGLNLFWETSTKLFPSDFSKAHQFTAVSSGFTIADTYYFSIADVARAFSPIVGASRAKALALAWSELYADCIVGSRVVAFPEGYGVPRLDKRTNACNASVEIKHAHELSTLHGSRLVNFSPGTLTFLAAANPDVRKR